MTVPIRILHVDDDPQFTDLTIRFLQKESEQFEAVAKTNATDALDYLSETDEEIHCIVSDYALPDLDGIEFLEAVRTEFPHVPFILFTGMGSESVARDALTGGATDYLQKQGGTEQYGLLANRIQDAVRQYRTEMERERSERSRRVLAEITSETGSSIDEKIQRLLELGCERMGVENGHVARIDRSSDRHEICYAAGTDLVRPGTVTDLQQTFCRHTLTNDGILAVHDSSDGEWAGDPAAERWDIGCYIGGRIDIGDDLYGTVCFVNRESRDTEFSEGERTFVDILTRWLSHMFERRRYEQSLRQEKARFDLLVSEVSTYAIFMLDPEGHIISWNEGARNIKGYTEDEIVGEHFSILYTDDDARDGLPDRLLAQAEQEGRVEDEGWRVRNDGTRFWALVSITALYDDTGDLHGFGKVTRDLTERHERSQRFEALIEHSSDVITVLDEEGTISYLSPAVERVLGYQPTELVGKTAFEYVHPDDRQRVLETLTGIPESTDQVTEWEPYRFQHNDGSWVWLESVGSNRKAGPVDGYVINSRHLEERTEGAN